MIIIFIVYIFASPCNLVLMSALFLPIGVKIAIYVLLSPCSYRHIIGMSRCLILRVSFSCLTYEMTASLSSYTGVGWPIGGPDDATNLLYFIIRLIPVKHA